MDRPTDKLTRRSGLLAGISIGLVVLLGAALRFYALGTESYWFDELYAVQAARESLAQIVAERGLQWPVLYYVLLHAWMGLVGTSEAATRSLSAVFGVGSIPLVYWLGRRVFGSKVGLVAALLMAISEFQVYYSQETRFYALWQFLTLVSFCLFVLCFVEGRIAFSPVYLVVSIAAFYVSTFSVFWYLAQNVYFIAHLRRNRGLLPWFALCQLLLLAAILPDPLHVMLAGSGAAASLAYQDWIPSPTISTPLRTVLEYVLPLRHQRDWLAYVIPFIVGGAFLVIGSVVFATRKGKEPRPRTDRARLSARLNSVKCIDERVLMVGLWFLLPIVLPLALSVLLTPVYVSRYTISAAPAFYLLLALALVSVCKAAPAVAVLGSVVIAMAPGLRYYYLLDIKEQWREVAAYVTASTSNQEAVLLGPGGLSRCFNWYYRGSLRTCDLDMGPDDRVTDDDLERCLAGTPRFWLVVRGTGTDSAQLMAYLEAHDDRDLLLTRSPSFTGLSVFAVQWASP